MNILEEKMKKEELEQISGGAFKEKLRAVEETHGYETRKCLICHK